MVTLEVLQDSGFGSSTRTARRAERTRQGRGRGGTQGEGFAGGGAGHAAAIANLGSGGRGACTKRRVGVVYTNALIVSRDFYLCHVHVVCLFFLF
jgi:hypothetical protein